MVECSERKWISAIDTIVTVGAISVVVCVALYWVGCGVDAIFNIMANSGELRTEPQWLMMPILGMFTVGVIYLIAFGICIFADTCKGMNDDR
jgi:hypothetical protein